jgi:hypothetical protein
MRRPARDRNRLPLNMAAPMVGLCVSGIGTEEYLVQVSTTSSGSTTLSNTDPEPLPLD